MSPSPWPRPTRRSASPFLSLTPDQLEVDVLQGRVCLGDELDATAGSEDRAQNVGVLLLRIADCDDEFVAFDRLNIARPGSLGCRHDCITDALKLDHNPPPARRPL